MAVVARGSLTDVEVGHERGQARPDPHAETRAGDIDRRVERRAPAVGDAQDGLVAPGVGVRWFAGVGARPKPLVTLADALAGPQKHQLRAIQTANQTLDLREF